MFSKSMHLKLLPLSMLVATVLVTPAAAETPACTHGTALMQTDAQAWMSLQNQIARLKTNVTRIRDEITEVIDINDDVGKASHDASQIHKVLSLIAPLFELAPSLQSGLEKTARAAEISHKNVLSPIYKVTDAVVTKGRLHEIRAEIDTKVLPNIDKYESYAIAAHLKSVKFGNDYIKVCNIAATLQKVACVSAVNNDIDAVYKDFNQPVSLLNTAVIDVAQGIGDANRILETSLSPSFKIALDLKGPVDDISKMMKALEKLIRKLEDEMKKYIHVRIHPFDWKFAIERLLKEWKAELKKLEHLVDVDKLKKEMREAVEKVLHPIVHDIEKFIHSLERDLPAPHMDLSKLEADMRAIEKFFESLEPKYDLSAIDKAIKEAEAAIRALEQCKRVQ